MKPIVIVALLFSVGCTAALKLPGTQEAQTEQIRLLTHAIEKQSDALIAVSGFKPVPAATPTPSPEASPGVEQSSAKKKVNPDEHLGEEPLSLIAPKVVK